jgi:hypothetical protein
VINGRPQVGGPGPLRNDVYLKVSELKRSSVDFSCIHPVCLRGFHCLIWNVQGSVCGSPPRRVPDVPATFAQTWTRNVEELNTNCLVRPVREDTTVASKSGWMNGPWYKRL